MSEGALYRNCVLFHNNAYGNGVQEEVADTSGLEDGKTEV